MTTQELLRQLRERDVRFSVDGDRLRLNAPKGSLPTNLAQEIAARKPEIIQLLRNVRPEAEPIRAISREQPPALSFAQERLWFLNRMQPESTAYNITAFRHCPEAVSVPALESALRALIARHASLRTAFAEREGIPVQVISPDAPVKLRLEDLSTVAEPERAARLEELIQGEARQPFDLARAPLFRTTLVRLGPNCHGIILAIHHIIADGHSLGVFFRDLGAFYAALKEAQPAEMPELAVQYADYAAWQRERLTPDALASELTYWKGKLAGSSGVLALPTDRPCPATRSFHGAVRRFSLSAEVSAALKRLRRESGASVFITLLAVFKALLFRYARQNDILVGTAVDNRLRAELEPVIGLFVNTLVLRTDVTGEMTGRELLESVRETVLEAHAHQDLPFEKLVEALHPNRTLARSPLFQVAFMLQNTVLSSAFETFSASSMFDLSLYMWEGEGERFYGTFEYSTELFDPDTIERMAGHFSVLAEAIAAEPDRPIGRLPLLTAAERTQVLETWNRTEAAYPRERTIPELFAEEAARHPETIAMIAPSETGGTQFTYGALEQDSNRLARLLAKFGAGNEMRIGILLERSPEAIVALLAALKAGGAYVPLDPAYPKERLAFMLEDAGIEILITRSEHVARFPDYSGRVVCLDRDQAMIAAEPAEALALTATADSLAYVMYTSGSTGQPKGVAIPHRGVVRLVKGADYARFGPDEVFLGCAPISFDASTFEIWGSLLNGGRLVLLPYALPTPQQLAAMIAAHGITTIWLTAGLFHQMAEAEPERLASVRQILAGGDVLSPPHVNRILERLGDSVLINGYGPTENTTFTCCYRMTASDRAGHTVPIGRPIANTRVYVLDADREPVPVGVPGELCIAGDGLARGYWGREKLDSAKFIANPFGPGRLYRTGDLVRYRADGNLEFLGRADNQVKIRGFRIELEEIETVLHRHPLIREAAVTVRQDASGSNSLHCYVVPRATLSRNGSELRRYLSEKLPEYMIPSAFVELEALPLTANGKVDRKALPDPVRLQEKRTGPRTSLEAQLVGLWEQVLDVRGIGVRDNFFELGGHSLLAVRLFARLEKLFGVLPISMLFQAPTIEQMAAKLSENGFVPPWRSLVPIQPGSTKPPLFLVPGLGGNVLCYSELVRLLGPEYPVYGLQSLGLDGKQTPLESIEAIAAHFIEEIRTVQKQGPYHLGGVCMGGVVAFEMAQQLRSQGEEVAILVLMETWPPEAIERRPLAEAFEVVESLARRTGQNVRMLWQLPRGKRWAFLRGKLDTVKRRAIRCEDRAADSSDFLRDLIAAANYRAVLHYVPQPYSGRILLVLAEARSVAPAGDPRLRWAELAGGNCAIHRIPATDSGWLLKEPHVQALAAYWRSTLEQYVRSLTASLS